MANVVTTSSSARAHTATLVVVGPSARLDEAAATLALLDEAGSLRSVLIWTDASAAPAREGPEYASIAGIKSEHLNNAIAALRLSSLPTVIWWRGGPANRLDGAAPLADRVILDVDDPASLWRRAPALFERTAITDIRWARLTRWRSAMAHFFDLPQVRDASGTFSRLSVSGADRMACTLFAGWLDAALRWEGRVAVELIESDAGARISSVTLSGSGADLSVRLLSNSTCLETQATVADHVIASRVLSLGDEQLPALLSQELRVRSRDRAFERALTATARIGM